MTCNCIDKINVELAQANRELTGYALMPPHYKNIITIQIGWIDKDKAPKGQRSKCPAMLAAFCPFCGKPTE